jgi:hypothetical protein
MKKALRVNTMANTDKIYTVIQARTEGSSTIKLQAVGPIANRDYGLSCTIAKSAAPDLYYWLVKAEAPITKTIVVIEDPIVNSAKDLYAKA